MRTLKAFLIILMVVITFGANQVKAIMIFDLPPDPVTECDYTAWLEEQVESLLLSYEPTGSIHAYPNLINPKKNKTVSFEGYIISKMAVLREGTHEVIKEVYIEIEGEKYEIDLNDSLFETEIIIADAIPGTELAVSLYAIDIFNNETLVDATRIKVRGKLPCTRLEKWEERLKRLETKRFKKRGKAKINIDILIIKLEKKISDIKELCENFYHKQRIR